MKKITETFQKLGELIMTSVGKMKLHYVQVAQAMVPTQSNSAEVHS